MRLFLLATAALAFGIISPIPALDRWQANFRSEVRASVHDYLPTTAQSAERRALLRDISALPDSAYRLEASPRA
jgi:hypothetical protein